MKPHFPNPPAWLKLLLAILFLLWIITNSAKCQSQANFSPKKPIYYDTMINCTALRVKRFLWGSKLIQHTHCFYIRYTKLPNGVIDTRHVRFYYPDRITRIRLIWYTEVPQYVTDTTSNRYEVIGELKMQH